MYSFIILFYRLRLVISLVKFYVISSVNTFHFLEALFVNPLGPRILLKHALLFPGFMAFLSDFTSVLKKSVEIVEIEPLLLPYSNSE